jgi:hypothetical protein
MLPISRYGELPGSGRQSESKPGGRAGDPGQGVDMDLAVDERFGGQYPGTDSTAAARPRNP